MALFQTLLIVALLAMWEMTARYLVDPYFISRPTLIVAQLVEWFSEGGMVYRHIRATSVATVLAFGLGSALAIVAGVLLGWYRWLAEPIEPILNMLFALPKIALAPLFVIWFGLGIRPIVMVSVSIVFFIVFYATFYGIRNVDPALVASVRVMGASDWMVFRKVALPAARGPIAVGAQMAAPLAFHGVVVAEVVSSPIGLGALLQYSVNVADTSGAFAALSLLTMVATVLSQVLKHRGIGGTGAQTL